MIIAYIILILTGIGCIAFTIYDHKQCKQKDIDTEIYNQGLQAEKTVLEEQNKRLREENGKWICSNEFYEKEVQNLSEKNEELKSSLNQLNDKRNTLTAEIQWQQGNLTALKQEYSNTEAQIASLSRTVDELSRNQKTMARNSFEAYCDTLDFEYSKAEDSHDAQLKLLEEDIEKLKELFYTNQIILSSSFENKKNELQLEYQEAESKLETIRATRAAALEAQLREQEIKEQATFYTLQLNEADKRDVAYLQSIEMNLREARPLRMLIWSTFYRDKANDLASRVGANGATGIYKITHIDSGISYIGQAKDIKERWVKEVKEALGIDAPATNKRCNFMREKGVDNFTFEILEKCSIQELDEKEQFYINLYQTYDYGLNGNRGISKK